MQHRKVVNGCDARVIPFEPEQDKWLVVVKQQLPDGSDATHLDGFETLQFVGQGLFVKGGIALQQGKELADNCLRMQGPDDPKSVAWVSFDPKTADR